MEADLNLCWTPNRYYYLGFVIHRLLLHIQSNINGWSSDGSFALAGYSTTLNLRIDVFLQFVIFEFNVYPQSAISQK